MTPLYKASEGGHLQVVELLLSKGAEVDSRDKVSKYNSQASFISATLLQVFLVNFRGFVLRCQHDSFPDPSCNFYSFVHDVSQGPSSNSQGHRHRKQIFVGGA